MSRDSRGKGKVLNGPAISVMPALLSGCSAAPSRSILGAYFPSWMICVLAGLFLTAVLRVVFVKAGIDEELPAPVLVYLAFLIAFSFGLWLLWLA